MSYGYRCSVSLSHGAVDQSVVCDCGISDYTHLLFALIVWNCILIYAYYRLIEFGLKVANS